MARADRTTEPKAIGEVQGTAFRDVAAFEAWLEANCASPVGIWLKLAKASSGIASLTSDEAVDVGLCYGFISGQRKGLDETYYLQKYVPRRPRSRWSQVNVAKVESLLAAGRMRPSGIAEVEAAKADGRWAAAYESQRNATIPSDFASALGSRPNAARAFEALGKTRRYAIVLRIVTTKSDAARSARIEREVAELER